MVDPPDGGVPALLLAVAYKLGWRASTLDRGGRPVGVLLDRFGAVTLAQLSADFNARMAARGLSLNLETAHGS